MEEAGHEKGNDFFMICFVFSVIIAQENQSGTLAVDEMVFCTSVEERTPVGIDTVFTSDVGTVYTFTKIAGATESTTISHVYYFNDQEMAKIQLNVGGSPWRTWSSKTIMPEWKGVWKVKVLDADGNVIKSSVFTVK
ncbi:MAG: DUF2914 domain-containing protein [Calditrichia bacterium]